MYRYCCQHFTKQKSLESIFLQIRKHKSVSKNPASTFSFLCLSPLYCLCVQSLETSVASMSSLIKRHSVCLFLSFASSSKVLTTGRHNIDILSKSRLPLSLCLCLQLSISVFLHQPPISASNICSPHCLYSGRLLSWCIQIPKPLLPPSLAVCFPCVLLLINNCEAQRKNKMVNRVKREERHKPGECREQLGCCL